jgi:aspartate 1-decarboxylase
LLKSKIHRATVSAGNMKREGGLTNPAYLTAKSGLHPCERILSRNLANGDRFKAYAIPGQRASGQIILNGEMAHAGKQGDLLTVVNFAVADRKRAAKWEPWVVVPGPGNPVVNARGM